MASILVTEDIYQGRRLKCVNFADGDKEQVGIGCEAGSEPEVEDTPSS